MGLISRVSSRTYRKSCMISRILKPSFSSLLKRRLYSTECVNILGVPSKEWNNKTYEPGQFFIHKKTPYRGIILGEVKAEERNIDELPNEESSLELANTSYPYYKVLVHFADSAKISQPPSDYIIEDNFDMIAN